MDKNAIFEKMLLEYVEREQIFGSLQIAQHDKVIYKKHFGYANLENKTPIDDDTVFRFYSMSKQFTAIAIMQLYDKGLLDVNDSVCNILPYCPLPEKVKLIHLLQHSSGLSESTKEAATDESGKVSYERLCAHLAKQPLAFEPGTAWDYLNTNYILPSLIVEHISGEKFSDYLKKNIFDPLGMSTAKCEEEGVNIPNLAVGYDLVDGVVCPAGRHGLLGFSLGAAYITGKMSDADCLHKAVREGKLLSGKAWDMIHTKADVSNFGFGCMILHENGIKFYQNNGGHLGFRTLHRYIPDHDFDVILLSNSGFGSARNDIGTMIFNCYLGGSSGEQILMDKGLT